MPAAQPSVDAVHRLHDMVTEEVSLVDRPANKRKFLVVKNEKGTNMPAGAEVVAGANGQLTAAGQAPAPTAKASISLTAGAKEALAAVLADCLENLTAASEAIDGATVVELDEEMDPGEVGDMLMECAEALEDAMYALAGPEAPPEAEAESAPPGAGTVEAGSTMIAARAPALAFGKRLAVRQAKRVIAKAEAAQIIGTTIQKYGRKLKKERAMRLQQAMGLLSSVLHEVMPAVVQASGGVVDKGAPPPPPKDEEVDPKTGKPKKKPVVPAAGGTAPPSAATKSEVEEVTKRVASLEGELKKSHEQLAMLRKNVTPSNATAVERTTAPPVQDDFSWPMDMNSAVEKPGSKNHFGD